MVVERPVTERELCDLLAGAADARKVIALGGANSKAAMAGAIAPADVSVSIACMRRVLQYEPRDLTISVEAGLPFGELSALLEQNRQTIPLDPPYFDYTTVGGAVASNASGPRRRMYGTARDVVIGMSFATLEGKMAKSGGMVVKNVAGFDMAKLLIGSFGTLAAIASVNFKLAPMPLETRSFVLRFRNAAELLGERDRLLQGVLQPVAMDALNPAGAARVGLDGFVLAIQAGGSPAVLARYQRELPAAEVVEGDAERALWENIREFTPRYVNEHRAAHVARVSTTLTAMKMDAGAVLARAGSGVSYVHFESGEAARDWATRAEGRFVFEYGDSGLNGAGGPDMEMMKSVKQLFDPHQLLNPGRLYGRI